MLDLSANYRNSSFSREAKLRYSERLMSIYRVIETDDGQLGKVKVEKGARGWVARDYLKFGARAMLPIAATAAAALLGSRLSKRRNRFGDLGDTMLDGGSLGSPMMTPTQKEKYMRASDPDAEQVGGALSDVISWARQNPKKLAAAGLTLAGLLALKAATSSLQPRGTQRNMSGVEYESDFDKYGYPLLSGEDFQFGKGLYAEPQDGGSVENPTSIQAVMFDRSKFNSASSRRWLAKHGFERIKPVDITPHLLRYRIIDPALYDQKSFRTIELKPGVTAVIGNRVNQSGDEMTGSGMLDWLKQNPKKATALGLGALLGVGVPIASELANAALYAHTAKPGHHWK